MKISLDTTIAVSLVMNFVLFLVTIGLIGFYGLRVGDQSYKIETLRREYTTRIQQHEQDASIRVNRMQEQINTQQFTFDRRLALVQEQLDRAQRQIEKLKEKAPH